MAKFIYVFNEPARDKLLSLKYTLLKSDQRNGIYIFENQATSHDDMEGFNFVESDTLTF